MLIGYLVLDDGAVRFGKLSLLFFELFLQISYCAVFQTGSGFQFALALGSFKLVLGILDFFPIRIYSYEFKFRKPDSRIFRAAAERIGEMLENILFVGDRIDTDIKPATKAGMQAVLKEAYTNEGKKPPEGIRKITLLSELPALIRKINGEPAESYQPIGAGSPKKRSFADGDK